MSKRGRPAIKLKALLIDLNGTLHLGSEPTKNAVNAIEKLRKAKIPFIFCSNSTKESSKHLLSGLNDMGFKAKQEELMTSLSACRQFVQERGYQRPYLLMSDSAKQEFTSSSSSAEKSYDSVILGLHPPSLSYDNLNIAFRILKQEPISVNLVENSFSKSSKPILIAPHKSSYQQSPSTDHLPEGLSLGIGPFVTLLEEAGGIQAEIVGKPTERFFELAIERLKRNAGMEQGFNSNDIGIIGDDISNDLGDGAKELGLTRILVKTGKYRPESEKTNHPPDLLYETFAEFVEDFLHKL
ncbi:TIGR01458 family HAD hydrolase [Kwoniella pini CBS 10737]|uniref:HAD hydrolase n=1 Tax=Kwoniella pini CBS 10737 TaxID=1296096 RepID=A0A1B9I609_9TREE|nr:HAD hydrolase [Kwoniella pini CBS 10737]OCF50956.1 HAD hydrolase [Kwoniella pini CBS 10737]